MQKEVNLRLLHNFELFMVKFGLNLFGNKSLSNRSCKASRLGLEDRENKQVTVRKRCLESR